jgi:DNA-binding LacI/PurR family transcriptional regulator
MATKTTKASNLLTSDSDMLEVDRVEQQIRKDLAALPVGISNHKLPRERILAERYGVCRTTLRQVIGRLKRDNLISSVWGKGTFVTPSRPKTKTDVLLLCNDAQNQYNTMTIGTLSALIRQRDHISTVVVSKDPLSEWNKILQTHPNACGVVLIGPFVPRKDLARLKEQCRLPLVHVGDLAEEIRGPAICNNVINDNAAMAYRATEYLIKHGHRNIAWLTWEKPKVWDLEIRRGYTEVLKMHGIEPDENLIIPSTYRPPGMTQEELWRADIALGLRMKESWLARGKTPTALIHSCGVEAWIRDLLHYCFKDFFQYDSIVAMTYYEILRMNFIGFREATAVCVKFEELARRALDLLLRPQSDKEQPRRETLEQTHFYRRIHGDWQESE